jgi:hypothetical protein
LFDFFMRYVEEMQNLWDFFMRNDKTVYDILYAL